MQSLKSPIFETCALGFKNIKCVLLQLCSASPCRWDMEQKNFCAPGGGPCAPPSLLFLGRNKRILDLEGC